MQKSSPRPCLIHDTSNGYMYCMDHKMMCCRQCHLLAYSRCSPVNTGQAMEDMGNEIKLLRKEAYDILSSVKPSHLDLRDHQEASAVIAIQRFFSDARRIVDDCERITIEQVKEEFKQLRSAVVKSEKQLHTINDSIDLMMSDLEKLKNCHSKGDDSHEGASVACEDHVARDNSKLEIDCAQATIMANKMSEAIVEMNQMLAISKDTLTRLESQCSDLSSIDPCIDRDTLDMIRVILRKACVLVKGDPPLSESAKQRDTTETIGGIHGESCQLVNDCCVNEEPPLRELVKKRVLNIEETHPVMRFTGQTESCPLIVGTCSPNKLMLIIEDGNVLMEVDLPCEPGGVYVGSLKVYVTLYYQDRVYVLRLSDLSLITEFPVSGGCSGITGINDTIAVVCRDDLCVRLVKDDGNVVAMSKHKFLDPRFVCAPENQTAIFVSDFGGNSIVVLSVDLSHTIRTITHPDLQSPMDLFDVGHMIYVTSYRGNSFLELEVDGTGGRVVLSGNPISYPRSVCYTRGGRVLAISNMSYHNIIIYEWRV